MPAVLSSCSCVFGCLRFISCVQSHLDVAALGLSRAAGGAVGPAAAGRQNASVLLLELGAHKVGVVGEAAAVQLDEEETHGRKTLEDSVVMDKHFHTPLFLSLSEQFMLSVQLWLRIVGISVCFVMHRKGSATENRRQ